MTQRVLILGFNYAQAAQYAEKHKLDRWRYVMSDRDLLGYRKGVRVLILPGYLNGPAGTDTGLGILATLRMGVALGRLDVSYLTEEML